MSKEKNVEYPLPNSAYSQTIHYSFIEMKMKNMAGKILTIIDSSITSEKQNKAVKDQIKGIVSDIIYDFQREASGGSSGHSVVLEDSI
jgi:hypothetical protein